MKIALITGGSRGLGRSMAIHLARAGHSVIITYQSRASDAQQVVDEINTNGTKAVALQLDAAQTETFGTFASSVQSVLKKTWSVERFDFLINNAGMGIYGAINDMSPAQFDQLMNVHLKAPFFLTQKLLPLMHDGGRILNVSSGLTRFSYPGYSAYAAMKGGVEVMTRYMALEFAARKISVNTLAPGAIETDFGGGAVRDNAELNKMIASQTALGRVGLPDDIGGAVAALLGDGSNWINGQRIEVAGGIHL
jgi:NAD(P)-dependent dehydrogenase (short-subunit alcohol dehydrogenase family)